MSANHPPIDVQEVPWLLIFALSSAALASGVSLRVVDTLLPRLAVDFGISIGQASQAITAFAVAYGLSQLLFGPIGDRFGKRRVIALACAASSLASVVCAVAPTHQFLAIGRLLSGTAAGAIIPLSMALIGEVVPYERRQAVLARFFIGQIFGSAFGIWLGGYAAQSMGTHLPFLLLAGAFLLAAGALVWVREGTHSKAVHLPLASGGLVRRVGLEFIDVLIRPWSRAVLITVFFEGACVSGSFAFIAAHLHQRFAIPMSYAAGLLMFFSAGCLCFALSARFLVGRLSEVSLVWLAAILMALALLVLSSAPSWGWAVPGCLSLGIGFFMLHNTLQTQATQMVPERRGTAVAAFVACFYFGQSAGVALFALAVGWFGVAWIFAAAALSLLLVAANFNRLRKEILVSYST